MIQPLFSIRAWLAFCLFGIAGCGSAKGPETHAIAVIGEAAPDLDNGYLFDSFTPNYTMGASGHVAFAAGANHRNGPSKDRVEALWLGRPEALKVIASVGQSIPDTEAVINAFGDTPMIVSKSGKLGFFVNADKSAPGYLPRALLQYDGRKLKKIIANGDAVPLPDGDGQLLNLNQFAMTDNGVLFMGSFARRQQAIWFWDGKRIELVIAENNTFNVGRYECDVRAVSATTVDLNRSNLAVFRISTTGNQCPRGGVIAWDGNAKKLLPVAMHLNPIADDQAFTFQSVTGDPRLNDDDQVVLHANVYSSSAGGAKETTLFQEKIGGPSVKLLDKNTLLNDGSEISLTHAIQGDGLAISAEDEVVHFVKQNRDRILVRTNTDDGTHAVIAHTGTTLGDLGAARIGDAQVNRKGDVIFTSFIDDGPKGGTYLQELWQSSRDEPLLRLAYIGQPVAERSEATIDRIESSQQSYEPKAQNTQGGRSRRLSDEGRVIFAGRLKQGTQWQNALFVAAAE